MLYISERKLRNDGARASTLWGQQPSCQLVGTPYSRDKMSAGTNSQDGCATNAKKARPTHATWPLGQSLPRSDCESGASLWYAGAGAGVTASFFCAHAPKLKALAKTVTIMIAVKILILFLTPFVAGCCRALYKRTHTAQRFFSAADDNALNHSLIVTGVSTSTRSKSSMTSAFRIRTHPWLSGWPILSSCFVP